MTSKEVACQLTRDLFIRTNKMRSYEQSVAVVTGTASGIGRSLSLSLARRGAKIVLADINLAGLEQIYSEVNTLGVQALVIETDVADAASLENLAQRAFAHFNRVDLLINNAGVLSSGASWELDLQSWQRVLNINLWSVIHAVRSFMPRLIEQGSPAHIVNTASMAGVTSGPWVAPYTVSKHGVVALSECLAAEMKDAGLPIKVSVVCPGPVSTNITQDLPPRDTPRSGRLNAHLRDLIHQGMSADELAEKVLAGVEAGQLWIFPHPEVRSAAEQRLHRLLKN